MYTKSKIWVSISFLMVCLVLSITTVFAVANHNVVQNTFTISRGTTLSKGNANYEYNSTGDYWTLINVDNDSTSYYMPATINGSPVTSVDDSAFENGGNITEITVDPNNTTFTSQDADGNECNAIMTVYTSNTTVIAEIVKGCTTTTIPTEIKSPIDSTTVTLNSIGTNAFKYTGAPLPDNLSGDTGTLTIPDNIVYIRAGAFYGCDDIGEIELGSGVTSIGQEAFDYCDRINSVYIPNSVQMIGANAFGHIASYDEATGTSTSSSFLLYNAYFDYASWNIYSDTTFSPYYLVASIVIADSTAGATYLTTTYVDYYWVKA